MNTTNERPDVEDYFDDWKQRETRVQEMIPVIGKLFNRQNIGIGEVLRVGLPQIAPMLPQSKFSGQLATSLWNR